MEIYIESEEIDDLATDFLTDLISARIEGVRGSRKTKAQPDKLGEPITIAILIAISTFATEKLLEFIWKKISNWIKKKRKPVRLKAKDSQIEITYQMTLSEGIPSKLKFLVLGK